MRHHLPSLSIATITGVALLACGSGPMTSIRSSSSRDIMPSHHDPALIHGHYTAPPDRALVAIAIRATAPDPGGAASKVRADIDQLRTALSDTPTCTLKVQNYEPPVSLESDWATSTQWRSQAWVTLDVDLIDVTDPVARMDRLDQCRGQILPLITIEDTPSKANPVVHGISLAAPTLVLDDPQTHLPALLERRAASLLAVATVAAAPQLHAEDYRCVPTGVVHVGTASFAGIALAADLECRVADVAPNP